MTKTLSTIERLAAIAATPVLLLALCSCAARDEAPAQSVALEAEKKAAPAPPAAETPGGLGFVGTGRGGGGAGASPISLGAKGKMRRKPASPKKAAFKRDANEQDDSFAEPEPQVQTRSWFPETFLFEPLVVTDEKGQASLKVRVPDRLTTWRVLALAHSRDGAQAGAVTSFLGTLPVYVEPVVPATLRVGDEVRLPLNIVNTTDKPVSARLAISVEGATLVGTPASVSVSVGPASSALRYARLRADRPAKVKLLARLAGQDAVVRTIDVVPAGRPVVQRRGGTLAAPRELTLARAAGAHGSHGELRLQVYPGALAVLRAELAAATGRGGLADDAFALLLAGRAPKLLAALGAEESDAEAKQTRDALRDLAIVSTQRVLGHARVLDAASASLIAEAALSHGDDNPVLERLGQRAVAQIAKTQAPDGTCGGQSGWTLQRVLVATADCARAAKDEQRVVLRAATAFDRHAGRIADPYTAAAILASGAASFGLQQKLRKVVRAAITKAASGDGSKVLEVGRGVVRADGVAPSTVEASALAVLALEGDAEAKASLADLGATVLAGYSPGGGWGDGRANLVCLKAAVKLFREPIPDKVRVTLSRDGTTVAEGTLERQRAREVLVLEAPAGSGSGSQRFKVSATPAIAGLGFALSLTDRVPWPKPVRTGGVELALTPPKAPRVGQTAAISLRATAPAHRPLTLRLALPAGVQVDKVHLDRLVREGKLSRYTAIEGALTLHAAGLAPAKALDLEVRTIPTLAGALQAGATSLGVARSSVELFDPPATWTIKP